MAAPGYVTVELECLRDGKLVESIVLDGGRPSYKIGRGKDCALVLKHPSLSRHHAEFSVQGTNLFVTDTDSSHGTYVDGKRLAARQPHLMRPPAECWFGGSTRRYRVGRVMVPDGGVAGAQQDSADMERTRRRNDELARAFKHLMKAGHKGINLAPDGYVKVADVIGNSAMRNYRATEEEVREMVKAAPALFEITEHFERGLIIRTRNINDNLLFKAPLVEIRPELVLQIKELVYWGLFGEWNVVRSEGLLAQDRQPIVFVQRTPGPKDKIPGTSSKPQIAVHLDIERAVNRGIKFFWTGADEDNVMCAGDHDNYVRPGLYSAVTNTKDGSHLLSPQDMERIKDLEEEALIKQEEKEAEIASKREADEDRGLVEGGEAFYKKTKEVVTVKKAHYDDKIVHYTIALPDGREVQTTADRLETIEVHDMRDKERLEKAEYQQAAGLGEHNPLIMTKSNKNFDGGRRKKRLKV